MIELGFSTAHPGTSTWAGIILNEVQHELMNLNRIFFFNSLQLNCVVLGYELCRCQHSLIVSKVGHSWLQLVPFLHPSRYGL